MIEDKIYKKIRFQLFGSVEKELDELPDMPACETIGDKVYVGQIAVVFNEILSKLFFWETKKKRLYESIICRCYEAYVGRNGTCILKN